MSLKIRGNELIMRMTERAVALRENAELCEKMAVRAAAESEKNPHAHVPNIPFLNIQSVETSFQERAAAYKMRADDLDWLRASIAHDLIHNMDTEELSVLGLIGWLPTEETDGS